MAWDRTIGTDTQNPNLALKLARAISWHDNVLQFLDPQPTNSGTVRVVRESTAVYDDAGWVACSGTPTSITMDPTPQNIDLQMWDISTEICDTAGLYNQGAVGGGQAALQMASLTRWTGRGLGKALINGTGVAPQPTGLINWISAPQILDQAGVALTLRDLDDLVTQVREKSGMCAFVTNPLVANMIREIMSSANYQAPTYGLPNGFQALTYRGFPILESDFVFAGDDGHSDRYSIYFANFDMSAGQGFGMYIGKPGPGIGAIPVQQTDHFLIYDARSATPASGNRHIQTHVAFIRHSVQAAARLKSVKLV